MHLSEQCLVRACVRACVLSVHLVLPLLLNHDCIEKGEGCNSVRWVVGQYTELILPFLFTMRRLYLRLRTVSRRPLPRADAAGLILPFLFDNALLVFTLTHRYKSTPATGRRGGFNPSLLFDIAPLVLTLTNRYKTTPAGPTRRVLSAQVEPPAPRRLLHVWR